MIEHKASINQSYDSLGTSGREKMPFIGLACDYKIEGRDQLKTAAKMRNQLKRQSASSNAIFKPHLSYMSSNYKD